ncbi:MAG: hypothetical protein ABL911_07840 [Gallionella sp.]|nr:hypothetical protein [Gallionella sp.]
MLTQQEANELLAKAKEATRKEILSWERTSRNDDPVIAVGEPDLQFVLSLSRNPFEISAHFRTKSKNIQLARIDTQKQHINPDGQRITGPHLHWYREGFAHLEWAEEIDWYDVNKPLDTLFAFLELIKTKFPKGVQEALI